MASDAQVRELQIRKAKKRRDEARIIELDCVLFSHGDTAADWLRKFGLGTCLSTSFRAFVAESCTGEMLGFLVYQIDVERQCFDVWSIGVDEPYRRTGIGRALISELRLELLAWNRRHPSAFMQRIVAPVNEYNELGQLFFKSTGFRAQLEREFYGEGEDDAMVFTWWAI